VVIARSVAALSFVLCLGASVVGCGTGGGAEAGCTSPAACGGDPTGAWLVQSACQSVPALAYTTSQLYPAQTTPQTPKLAKPQPSNKASGDWCSELVYVPADPNVPDFPQGKVTNVNLYYPPAPLDGASLILGRDHSLSASIEVISPYTTHFTTNCLIAHGANPTCSDLAKQIHEFYTPMPNYQDIKCCAPGTPADQCCAWDEPSDQCKFNNSSNGCDCSYYYRTTNASAGAWQVSGENIYFFTDNAMQPMNSATFCASNNQLTISGRDGLSLFNVNGLRTLTLGPCTDEKRCPRAPN
jgi:hypothetical protein